jgi:hypothetical protein
MRVMGVPVTDDVPEKAMARASASPDWTVAVAT